jgi:hypothetical protein
MFLKSLSVFIPEPLIVRHPVPYGPELRRDEAIAAFSTMPLLEKERGHSTFSRPLVERKGTFYFFSAFEKKGDILLFLGL